MKKTVPMKKILRGVLGGLAFLLAAGLYIFYLDYQITSKFEFHRWNLPSRVYSSPYYLYPGLQVTQERVAARLQALAYRQVSGGVNAPGEFVRIPGKMIVYLRGFAYPDGKEEAYPLVIYWDESRIAGLGNMETYENLPTARLEPELVGSIFDEKMEDRTLIKLDDIPGYLADGIVSIEDSRFYKHHGVDPIAIARALVTDIIHMKIVQGGSTLTQQLVKNFFLTSKKTLLRKMNEAVMALLLERRYSKEEVLESYMNEIYFGQKGAASVSGVAEAARFYFSKEVSQLSLAESALLAGIIRSPGRYSPFHNLEAATERRNLVLEIMREHEKITDEEYQEALGEKIYTKQGSTDVIRAPFFIDYVQRQLKEEFPAEKLQSEGLRIFTTLDMYAQEEAERAVKKELEHLEKGYPYLQKILKEKNAENPEVPFHLEGVLIALEPQTGYVRAFVGGRDYALSQFNRAIDAKRQPGSAFKPFVYLTALDPKLSDHPYTLASLLEDTPFSIESGDEMWEPKNYDEEFHGTVSLREALEKSYNVATSRLAIDAGLENIVVTGKKAGIGSELKPYPSLALGAFEVSMLELAEAYTVFPNQGVRAQPIAILQVETPEGDVLTRENLEFAQVFDPASIYLVNSLLRGVVDRGTAALARARGLQGLAGGKTGTSSDYRDSWFVGFNPKLLALTWVGFDTGEETKLSGAVGALPIWVDFMKAAAPVVYDEDFKAPDKILLIKIDPETGLLSDKHCPDGIFEAFRTDVVPQKTCPKK